MHSHQFIIIIIMIIFFFFLPFFLLCRVLVGRDIATRSRPVGMEPLRSRFIHALIRMSTKVVSLRLKQIRRKNCGSISVVKRQCCAKCGHRRTLEHRSGYRISPPVLCIGNGSLEEVVEKQVGQLRVLRKRVTDISQKSASDDTATSPHERNGWQVERPVVGLGSFHKQHVSLSIRADLGRVQCQTNRFDKLGFVAYGRHRRRSC
mmetsp:Transcript_676/g.1145  ORF Transcript_676/g.1145 Transcript_676/m.1145 type:complete len:205 (+) Transcript_676:503-1117(+)